MASSESKAKSEGYITPAGEENLKLDDDTSKGETPCQLFSDQNSLLDSKTVQC